MVKKTDLYNLTKQILKDVRFGNLSGRLSDDLAVQDSEFVSYFNSMLEALEDRENMIKEYRMLTEAQNRNLNALFNMLPDGAMTLSENFNILSMNNVMAKSFKVIKKRVLGVNIQELLKKYKIREYPSDKIVTDCTKYFETGRKNLLLEFVYNKKNAIFSVSIKKFVNSNQQVNYFIVSKNITSDINMEKLKNTFLATLTHDLKVPILAEAKVIELLSKEVFGKNTTEQKEALSNMLINNRDMMSLVTTLLDVYKIDDGLYSLNKQKTDILELITQEIEKVKYLLLDSKCTIKLNKLSNIPEIYVDSKEISRVIRNILTNAINFATPSTQILVELYSDKTYFYVNIKNKGKGIDKNDIPHIFDRYFTADKKYRKVGTGLGMYLSKKIVQLHDGEIFVDSIINDTTIFTVKLPIID